MLCATEWNVSSICRYTADCHVKQLVCTYFKQALSSGSVKFTDMFHLVWPILREKCFLCVPAIPAYSDTSFMT